MARPGLGRRRSPTAVGDVGRDRPSCRRLARLRTCGVGASSPASRISRSTRLRLVRMPRRRRRARDLLVALADERRLGDLAADRHQQLAVGHRADRPGRRRARWSGGLRGAASAALLARRRPGDPGDAADARQRGLQPFCDVQRLGDRGWRPISSIRPAGCRCPSPARRSCAAPRRADGPPPARGRALQALPAGSQELLTPRADRARPPGRSRAPARPDASPRSSRRTTSSLRRALQRTSRPPSGRPSGAPERDRSSRCRDLPSDPP